MDSKTKIAPSDVVFQSVSRQEFREFFQPSRIVLGVFQNDSASPVNVITLCFDMHCSYKPAMFAFAIWRGSHTFTLLDNATECVLAVPGERLAQAALLCGTKSGRDINKINACGLTLTKSEKISVPGIGECIANVEIRIVEKLKAGDHQLVIGEVLRFGVDPKNHERCLLSVGRNHEGYEVLARGGIHRIGVVQNK